MISGDTKSGFHYEFDEELLDDFDTFECLHKVERGSIGYICDVIDRVLGEEQKSLLKAHVAAINGKCTLTGMITEWEEIMAASKTGKNS